MGKLTYIGFFIGLIVSVFIIKFFPIKNVNPDFIIVICVVIGTFSGKYFENLKNDNNN
ncbi:MAG: hypothetical protein SOZ89_04700 [Peptoniphilaceae bacterium]|nr:hypothetical protein [Peptoniphilaceae bacterium]MDD7383181.1 hypothetical protein [Peptoniphilaceae bacterium]MDY3738405.1 hypothetical protein [Peptoniphilaceae bacterium]